MGEDWELGTEGIDGIEDVVRDWALYLGRCV
jgi:hypothetical protein